MSRSQFSRHDAQVEGPLREFRLALTRALLQAPANERADLIRELELHVLEAAELGTGSAKQRMEQAIADLGPLSSFVPDLAAELRIQSSARRGSPTAAASLLLSHLGGGLAKSIALMLCGAAMLFALLLATCALGTLWIPEAGLYWNSLADFTLSFETQEHAHKVSNGVFVPLALALAAAIYLGCARVLVWVLRRR